MSSLNYIPRKKLASFIASLQKYFVNVFSNSLKYLLSTICTCLLAPGNLYQALEDVWKKKKKETGTNRPEVLKP